MRLTGARGLIQRRIKGAKHRNESKLDSAWAVIDMERDEERRKQAEKESSGTKGVKVALSDPCYEVWTLLHLEDTGVSFNDCKQVLDRIKQRWQDEFAESFDRKTQADYTKIIALRHKATERARKHHERGDPSWTEVYKIIEAVEAHVLRIERSP